VSGETPEQVLRVDTSSLFERLFEFSPDGVLVTDQTGSIVRANAQTEHMFGYDRRELIGQLVEILIPERLRSRHPNHRSDYAAQPHTRPMGAGLDLFARRKDGSEFPVDIMLSPVNLDGKSFVLAVVRGAGTRSTNAIGKHPSRESRRLSSILRTTPLSSATSRTELRLGTAAPKNSTGGNGKRPSGNWPTLFYKHNFLDRPKRWNMPSTATTTGKGKWFIRRRTGDEWWWPAGGFCNVIRRAIR
jgi:PAS domain S-box-containing protein